MTVCVTGDVHHMSLGTRDQEYLERTELETALEYAEIAANHQIPVTLFITGKGATEEPERVRELSEMDNVELGGHNYFAFDTPVHSVWRGLEKVTGGRMGSWNGPKRFQAWEIRKTLRLLQELGVDIQSWRDHAYRHDEHTDELLTSEGFTHFSDAVGPDKRVKETDGLSIVPVNTPPDHEHIYHAFRTPEFVAKTDFSGPFGHESWEPDEWVSRVLTHTRDLTKSGEVATILAHPSCMWLADEFDSFERLCQRLEAEKCVKMREI